MDPAPRNELADATSPYLLQHSRQPVHWKAWSAAALAVARAADRPIMVSIGYAACHWCHVMAHESFDDPAVAEILNASFVSIKVDREERPDIDLLYMTALQAMGEQGGWPLTMFLTPSAEPFWGGTYFPPHPRAGRPAFTTVLQAVAAAFSRGDPAVQRNAVQLAAGVRATARRVPGTLPEPATLAAAAARIIAITDPDCGGLRGAPKFPNFPVYRFLAQRAVRGESGAREAVHAVLDALCAGGIYDHAGGGLFRYSTDRFWLVPHFEKMTYDNAQFVELLALADAGAEQARYRDAAAATVAFMLRELSVEGGFAASLDADTPAGEGAYYVWTEYEIDRVLGERATAFKAAFGVTGTGNWEGKTILRRVLRGVGETATFAEERAALAAARDHRPRPALDDKVLGDWNGLAVAALCRAALVYERPDWLAAARDCFAKVTACLRPGGRWHHAWRSGRISAAGLLDDLAALGNAALSLFESTGEPDYLALAEAIAAEADRWFGPAEEGYFMSASDAPDIPASLAARPRSAICSAVPSGSGLMAQLLARLFHLTGQSSYYERARQVIEAFAGRYDQPIGSVTLLAAAEMLEDGRLIVIAGDPGLDATRALLATARGRGDPASWVLHAEPGRERPASHPAHGKTAPRGAALAYVCQGGVCRPPVSEPCALLGLLR